MKELKPSNAVGIVETDLNVDFDAPVGYEESLAASKAAAAAGGEGGGSGATGAIGGGGINMPAPASGGTGCCGAVPHTVVFLFGAVCSLPGSCLLKVGYDMVVIVSWLAVAGVNRVNNKWRVSCCTGSAGC